MLMKLVTVAITEWFRAVSIRNILLHDMFTISYPFTTQEHNQLYSGGLVRAWVIIYG